MAENQTLQGIVNKTDSELILFFAIVAIIAIILVIPMYRLKAEISRKKDERGIKEQQLLIQVIQKNSEVISELKSVLESTNSNCAGCKKEQLSNFRHLEDKQEMVLIQLTKITEYLKNI